MKKLKYLVILLVAMLMIPFGVFAEDEAEATDNNEESKEAILYFFRGEGCSHCAEAEEWFKSIEDEYGQYFEIKDYETWYSEDNSKLMEQVAEARGETAEGVPYIIVGDKSWNGFAEEYKDEILDQIKKVYEQDVSERYDVMKFLDSNSKKDKKEKSGAGDVVALIVIVLVVGGAGFGIYQARKNTD